MTGLIEQLKVVLPDANEVQLQMTIMIVREALREELKSDRKRDLARTRKRHQRDRERDISVTKTGHVTLVSPLDPPSGSLSLSQPPDPERARSISESKLASRYSADFLHFWALYPKKVGKEGAWKRWKAMKPDLATVSAALSWQVKSRQWEDGFIWDPAKYLRDKHWLDERDISVTANGHARPSPPMYDPEAEDPR